MYPDQYGDSRKKQLCGLIWKDYYGCDVISASIIAHVISSKPIKYETIAITISKHFTVEKYYSGESLVKSKKKYDLVFLDIEMKELDGIETAQEIRSLVPSVIVIFPPLFLVTLCTYLRFTIQLLCAL